MTSQIDPTKPGRGKAYTSDVRSNFGVAADEITALQQATLPPGVTAFMTAWLATLPTEPQPTVGWWNNGGSPAYS